VLTARIEEHIRRHDLIPPGGDVTCLVSGGADSTCLWHALREVGYRVSALHVNHRLRGAESDADAEFCRDVLGARVVERTGEGSEAELRSRRYGVSADLLRATGHTASDQVETILYRLVARGSATGMAPRSTLGNVVHPLLAVWREETVAYCDAVGLEYRVDSSNADTKRGLIRDRILPLLRQLHPAADENLLRLLDARQTMPPGLAELLAEPVGSKRLDLGGGLTAVREYERLWLERSPVALEGEVHWGEWRIRSNLRGLRVRGWKPGDRLAGRTKKIQDVFVDAKIPQSEREGWPLVVRGDDVIAVPGIVEHPEVRTERA
jgi:tRNA(Ile)-lysidine synthetase-like protein